MEEETPRSRSGGESRGESRMAARFPPPQASTAQGSAEHRSVLNDLKKEAELLTKYHRELVAGGERAEAAGRLLEQHDLDGYFRLHSTHLFLI